MIIVHDIELDFDISCPEDVERYRAAGDQMAAAAAGLPEPPTGDMGQAELPQYIAYLRGQCGLLTEFIDAAFGAGTCNKLLGKKTSLDKLLDMCDAIGEAVELQGKQIGVKLTKYTPNRATRRAVK